jgi:hypothetical protein
VSYLYGVNRGVVSNLKEPGAMVANSPPNPVTATQIGVRIYLLTVKLHLYEKVAINPAILAVDDGWL